jgi:tRNA nucleotidyltransferase (CCA-adding enzyme)
MVQRPKQRDFPATSANCLVHNYGSFKGVIEGIANLQLPLIITSTNLRTRRKRNQNLCSRKFGKRFIVIDPTDSNRNVAANVSDESLLRFAIASRNLLNLPSRATFYGEGRSDVYSEKKLLENKEHAWALTLYVLHFDVPDIAGDIIWQQLKKARLRMHDVLKEWL